MNRISCDVLNLSSEAAVIVRSGKVVYANAAASELLGTDCTGKSTSALFGPDIAGTQASSFVADFSTGGKSYIIRVSCLSGDQIYFICEAVKPSSVLNEPFFCAMRNSLMNAELTAALIRDRAEQLTDAPLLSQLSVMAKNYSQIIRLLNNASFVVNPEGGISPFNLKELNLSSIFEYIIYSIGRFGGLPRIEKNLGEDITLYSDQNQMTHLLLNLLSNCFIHAKGCTKISVVLKKVPDCILLSVSDDGEGMEARELHTVFERYRHEYSLCNMGRGAGLGLTVVRRIAEMHGGTVLLESRPGQGTTVRVSLRKTAAPVRHLHSAPADPVSTRDVLTGLSGCLSAECFSEDFMD